MGVKLTLSKTESGGNPNAYRKNKDGREFFGEWQFGEARLKDLGLGQDFTLEQFKSDPELQSTIMDRHIADFDRRITDEGLDAYEGTTVGGVPMTRNAMYAMAHLGGFGGMKKFLTSGGQYNPADELGTSLADYAVTHGGPTMAAANPEQNKESRLRKHADVASLRADDIATTAERLAFGAMNMQAPLNAGLRSLQGPPAQGMSMNSGPPVMQPATQLGFGLPAGTPSAFEAQGIPEPIRMGNTQLSFNAPAPAPQTPGATPGGGSFSITPTVSTRAPTQQAATEEDEPQSFMSRLAHKLLPNADDPDDAFRTLIGGIGVGLGQMSAGQPVDLQPYFANVSAQKQAIIDGQRAEAQQQIDNDLAYMNAETQRANMKTGRLRLEHDIEQDILANGVSSVGLTPELLEEYGHLPAIKAASSYLASPDKADRELGRDIVKRAIADAVAKESVAPQAVADLYDAFVRGDDDAITDIIANNNIPIEDLSKLATMTDPGNVIRLAERLADANTPPEMVDALMTAARLSNGGALSDDAINSQLYKDGYEFQQNLQQTIAENADLNTNVDLLRSAALEAARDGDPTAGFTDAALAGPMAIIKSAVGGESAVVQRLEELTGVRPEEYQKMSALARLIVLQAARPLMEGQGQVTDSERRELAMSMVDIDKNDYEAQMAALDRLQVLGMIDEAHANYYASNKAEHHKNFEQLSSDIVLAGNSRARAQLATAKQRWTMLRNAETSAAWRDVYKPNGKWLPEGVAMEYVAPKLTPKQWSMYRSVIEDEDFGGAPVWFDVTTNTLMLGDNVFSEMQGPNMPLPTSPAPPAAPAPRQEERKGFFQSLFD